MGYSERQWFNSKRCVKLCSEESNINNNSEGKGMVEFKSNNKLTFAKMCCLWIAMLTSHLCSLLPGQATTDRPLTSSFHPSNYMNRTKVYVESHVFCAGIREYFKLYTIVYFNILSFNLAPPWNRHFCCDWNFLTKIEWISTEFATYFHTVVYDIVLISKC